MGTIRDDSGCADDTRICGSDWLLLGSIRCSFYPVRVYAFQSSGRRESKDESNCTFWCNCDSARNGSARAHPNYSRKKNSQPQISQK